jgi:hypothetical protein
LTSRLDDLARGVRLHGIVDVGAAKARLQAAILRLDRVDIEHQRRAVEGLRTDEGLDPGRSVRRADVTARAAEKSANVAFMVISNRPGPRMGRKVPSGDVTVAT